MRDDQDIKDSERDHFDHLAETTGEVWWGGNTKAGIERFKRRARLIARELKRYNDPVVVEIGCGTGAVSSLLLNEMPELRLIGGDISPKCVELANERYKDYKNAKFQVFDATNSGMEDNSIDAVIGNAVLHHIPLEDTLRESFRILKPGGLFWFAEPNMMNPQVLVQKNVPWIKKLLQDSPDEIAFFRWALKKNLEAAGFEKVFVVPFDFLHPITPSFMIDPIDALGRMIEKIPVLREIAGSLLIKGHKPKASTD
ncbi:MAG: class I SAM-dependent methyltransferase [Candidatus Lindowbacteria bacterium]|nr:class I SAM-dependent methyltransferase [Candidatus Lindowbacteria bacterium]